MLRKPSRSVIDHFLARQKDADFSYREVGATHGSPPSGYTVDQNSVRLGQGSDAFRKAVKSLQSWQMFKLGWVDVFPAVPIEVGATVAVRIKHFGFWSLNACRIVYVFETERSFGFAYGTLRDHAEHGEERFSIEWSADDDSVRYRILAFSRPQKWQARIGRPLTRRLQRQFALDSMAAMQSRGADV